jgi:hypothetical protein
MIRHVLACGLIALVGTIAGGAGASSAPQLSLDRESARTSAWLAAVGVDDGPTVIVGVLRGHDRATIAGAARPGRVIYYPIAIRLLGMLVSAPSAAPVWSVDMVRVWLHERIHAAACRQNPGEDRPPRLRPLDDGRTDAFASDLAPPWGVRFVGARINCVPDYERRAAQVRRASGIAWRSGWKSYCARTWRRGLALAPIKAALAMVSATGVRVG